MARGLLVSRPCSARQSGWSASRSRSRWRPAARWRPGLVSGPVPRGAWRSGARASGVHPQGPRRRASAGRVLRRVLFWRNPVRANRTELAAVDRLIAGLHAAPALYRRRPRDPRRPRVGRAAAVKRAFPEVDLAHDVVRKPAFLHGVTHVQVEVPATSARRALQLDLGRGVPELRDPDRTGTNDIRRGLLRVNLISTARARLPEGLAKLYREMPAEELVGFLAGDGP